MNTILKRMKRGRIRMKDSRINRKRKQPEVFRKTVSGITVIELVLILVIVIALLLIFKNQLIDLINTIFDKIVSESSGI